MKRGLAIGGLLTTLLGTSILLTGCEESTVIFEGEEMTVTEAEEKIADLLEVENPDRDIDISIYDDTDD